MFNVSGDDWGLEARPPAYQLSRNDLLSTDFIDRIFIDIWEEYRQIATDLRQKVQLRENIRKLKSDSYTYKTRIHKALSHIEPLVNFHLIERNEERNEIYFSPKTVNGFTPIDVLVKQVGTISNMEELFAKFRHFEIIGSVFKLAPTTFIPIDHSKLLRKEIIATYLKARTEPSKMAPISTISDVISAKFLAKKGILINRPDIEQELDLLKMTHPGDVHYHVDMYGKKAFIVFSDNLSKAHE